MLQNTVKDLGYPSLNFSYAKVNYGQQDQGSQVHPPNNLSPERDGTLDPPYIYIYIYSVVKNILKLNEICTVLFV